MWPFLRQNDNDYIFPILNLKHCHIIASKGLRICKQNLSDQNFFFFNFKLKQCHISASKGLRIYEQNFSRFAKVHRN